MIWCGRRLADADKDNEWTNSAGEGRPKVGGSLGSSVAGTRRCRDAERISRRSVSRIPGELGALRAVRVVTPVVGTLEVHVTVHHIRRKRLPSSDILYATQEENSSLIHPT